ncbi:MAG: hypothetical protein IT280_11695 [Ignavibacteria bacterium]|nr:hypothetical protein [Ignavibacteria bacterium]
MKNTKLILLLKTFTPSEIKKFRDFVNSPFYNKNKNVQKLNDVLMRYYPHYDSELLNEEKIFAELFIEEKFDYFKIKNISSDLYMLGLEFLSTISNSVTEFTGEYNLMVQLRMRKLFNLHSKLVKSKEKSLNEKNINNEYLLYDKYLLSTESQLVDLFEKPSSISGILNEFDNFYEYLINNLLMLYNLLLHISKGNNVQLNIKMLDEIVLYLEKGPVSSQPTTIAYQYLILLKIKQKEEYYYILKDNYFKNLSSIDDFAAYKIHMYMFGYCADMYNFNGNRKFENECYELYKHSFLNNRVTSGELLYPDFINYVKVFTRVGDIELAEKFIKDYTPMLPEEQRDNAINFSNAFILHKKGELAEALRLLTLVNFQLAILKIQVKIMQVQLNYELGFFEETREIIELFKKTLLKETALPDNYKNPVMNFLYNTLYLLNLHLETNNKKKKQDANLLREKIEMNQQNHFGIKFWLNDMIEKF